MLNNNNFGDNNINNHFEAQNVLSNQNKSQLVKLSLDTDDFKKMIGRKLNYNNNFNKKNNNNNEIKEDK